MITWRIEEKVLPLKYSWKISRNSSDFKVNLFIYAEDENGFSGLGEVAPNVRYGEIPAELLADFNKILSELPQEEIPVEELAKWLKEKVLHNSLRFGIESAYVHYLCSKRNISVNHFFGLPYIEKVATSYSLPIMPASEVGGFIEQNNLERFPYIKVKINKNEGLEIVKEVIRYIEKPLLIDANESYTDVDELLQFSFELQKINANILLLEQPMPAHLSNEYKYLKAKSIYPVFADESMTDVEDISHLKDQFHGVNMKLMKAGSYLTGISQMKQAQEMSMQTMVGCMVETSAAIFSAMHICSLAHYADLDGFLILKEDPFGIVAEKQGFLQKV